MSVRKAFQPCVLTLRGAGTERAFELRNRIAMAPMTRRKVPFEAQGIPTEQMIAYYERRAKGEVGLIITEGVHIDDTHSIDNPCTPRIHNVEQANGWKAISDAVHREGSKFMLQLWHTGRFSSSPISPIEIPSRVRKPHPIRPDEALPSIRAMDAELCAQVSQSFAEAARLCKEVVGSDGVEIHGAHGYLLDSFIDPVINTRTDKYGPAPDAAGDVVPGLGAVRGRMRFPLEVVRAVRAAVGSDYPIVYRWSQWALDRYHDNKFTHPEELRVFLQGLLSAGVDIVHVSCRNCLDAGFPEFHPTKTLAEWSKELCPELIVIAVGKVTVTLNMMESYDDSKQGQLSDPEPCLQLVEGEEGKSPDLLAVGRALIPNPDWVQIVRDQHWSKLKLFNKRQLSDLY